MVNIMQTKQFDIKKWAQNNAIYLVLIAIIILITVKNPAFLSLRVFRDILMQSSTRLIMAMGCMFVILSGGADLSGGRMLGAAAVLAGSLAQMSTYANKFFPNLQELPIIVPIIACLLMGMAMGLLNGIVVAKLNVPAFIGTLGVQLIIYGGISIFYNMEPNRSQPLGGFLKTYSKLGTGSFFGIPYILIIAVVLMIACHIVLNYHRFGKTLFAVGGNQEAARVSGINVQRIIMIVYIIAGAFYGLTGALEAARTGGATNNYGQGYELDAIAACVVGGCSVAGGVGAVPGVAIGVTVFTVIQYGMTFVGINPYWQNVVKGAIIVIAVAIDVRKYAKKR